MKIWSRPQLVCVEYLDWRGRMDILEAKHPLLWKAVNARPFRLILLFLIFGMLAETARQRILEHRAQSQSQSLPSSDGTISAAQRDIQNMLTKLSQNGTAIREGWFAAKGTPEDIQRPYAKQVHQWHAEIERYLRTIPRGDAYSATLKGAIRTGSGGYTIGINPNLYDDWDLLASDLAILNEFMKDPYFGKP